jgi:AraC-like DNA-binding protein
MGSTQARARSIRRTAPPARPASKGEGHKRTVIASSVQGWVLPHLIGWVESRGVDASPIRRLFGRIPLEDPNVRVPEAMTEAAWRLAADATRDEALGVHLAESVPRGALDLIEYALRSSSSLGKGLDRLARYGRLLSDRVAARTDRKGESFLFLVHDAATTPLHPARAEFALALALKLARESTGADIKPVRVCFAHAAPSDISEHQRFFHVRVRFGVGSSSMILSASDAFRPLQDADPALVEIIRRRLENALGDRDRTGAGAMSTRVRHMLVEHLGQSVLTLDAVADGLAVSRRTLTRRLTDEHASFRQILDDVRSDFARALLQDRSLSIGDIAFFLQYSEPAAFHRSFRRWTGLTPQAFRQS